MGEINELSEILRTLLPEYLSNRQSELLRLKKLSHDGDLIEIKKIGHKLAGNAGSYGLNKLGDIGARLEESVTLDEVNSILVEYEKVLTVYLMSN